MKLIRFGKPGSEKPGVLVDEGTRIDVSAYTRDYDQDFFAYDGLTGLGQWLNNPQSGAPRAPVSAQRLGPPAAQPQARGRSGTGD